jgi:hypothetical protein
VWERVSERLQNNKYSSPVDFMEDVQPIKNLLLMLQHKTRPTKRRVKYVELVFRRLLEIASPTESLIHSSNSSRYMCRSNPFELVIDSLTGENAADVLEAFHSSGKSYALTLEINKEKKLSSGRLTNGNCT